MPMLHCPHACLPAQARRRRRNVRLSTMNHSLSVKAPARLHMGFLDLGGSFGRRYGGVGMAVEVPRVRLTARRAPAIGADGPQSERAQRYAGKFLNALHLDAGVHIEVHEAIPEHAGLGSGTQLALAVGVAIARLLGRSETARDVAALHERGQRSGIGLAAFEQGGFVLDGGRGAGNAPPPLLARLDFPAAWRVLLIMDEAMTGLHGAREIGAFGTLPPWRAETSAQLCHELLLRTLPALAEADLHQFGLGIATLQKVVGDHFAPVQGGRFASVRVAQVLRWLEERGVSGVGQSSWGPTGFGLMASESQARELMRAAQSLWPPSTSLRFVLTGGRNAGAEVLVQEGEI